MMIRRITVFTIILFTAGLQFSSAAETGLRKYAGEFMSIDVSARAQAMGGAFSSLSDDVYATFYNPAGLVQVQSMQIGFTHFFYIALKCVVTVKRGREENSNINDT